MYKNIAGEHVCSVGKFEGLYKQKGGAIVLVFPITN